METKIAERMGKLFPEMSAAKGIITAEQMNNNLAATTNGSSVSSTIWQAAAEKVVTTNGRILAAFDTFTSNIDNKVDAGSVLATVHVERVDGVGSALHDTSDWSGTEISNAFIPVTMHRISRPFNLSFNDTLSGNKVESKLEGAINAVIEGVFDRFAMTVAEGVLASSPTIDTTSVTPTTFDPQYVAQSLSGLFGDKCKIETLLLNPTLYAKLVPYNTLGIQLNTPGALGIKSGIYESALMDRLNGTAAVASNKVTWSGGTAVGFATGIDGVLMATGRIDFTGLESAISVRDLGTYNGINLQLKSWIAPNGETILNSVEAMVGFALGDASRVRVLVPAA